MASLNQMLERCSTGRRYIYLCLQNRTTSSDQIEILPGLKANVIIHGHPTLKLMSAGGEFKVRPTGDQASRDAMLLIIDTLPGQWYKIKYEKLSLAGKPTKPVGIAVRKCDENGDPLE